MRPSLNHPNIAAIYDLQEANGSRYLVLELVEGETLADRIARGPIPVEEALDIAKNICSALEAAHEKGIVHRDLKPANIKLTPAGQVKVLDFGLAKIAEAQAAADFSNSPTLVSGSAPGVILGTAAYMSPEQASGKEVDKRTDIWALGCVLYELLTGKQVFSGDTVTEIIAAVLKSEPDWSALPDTTSPHLRSLLRRCLQKDAKKRSRDAADVRIEIEDGLSAPALAPPPMAIPARPLWQRTLPWAMGLLACLLTGVAVWSVKPKAPPSPVSRMVITLPTGDRLPPADQRALAFSPDGKLLAYVAIHDTVQQLYLRAIDGIEAQAVAGSEGATDPFFSPDSQWIGFHARGKLKKVSVGGGPVVTLSDASALTIGHGASWGDNDTIAFQTANQGGLWQVSAAGGAAQPLTALNKDELIHSWPDFLPGGKALLLTANSNNIAWNVARLAAYASGTDQRHDLNLSGVSPRYATTGHLIFAQAGTLIPARFDAKRLEVRGPTVPVVEGVLESLNSGNAQYAISAGTGSLASAAEGRAYAPPIRTGWLRSVANVRQQRLGSRPSQARSLQGQCHWRRGKCHLCRLGRRAWAASYSRNSRTRPQSRDIPFRLWGLSRSERRGGKMKSRIDRGPEAMLSSAWRKRFMQALVAILLLSSIAAAQQKPEDEGEQKELTKQVQNPVSSLISVPLQNNSNFGIGPLDRTQNVLNIQPVIPSSLSENWNLITRVVMPVVLRPNLNQRDASIMGLGDINPTFFLSPAKRGKLIWGIGPDFVLPTATNSLLGQGKWSGGPAVVALVQPDPWSIGVLINNVWSFAGESDKPAVNQLLLQYFLNYNLKKGWYIALQPIITANWKATNGNTWTVPFGGGVGRVFRLVYQPVNVTLQFYGNAVHPAGASPWSMRVQMAFLYPKKPKEP